MRTRSSPGAAGTCPLDLRSDLGAVIETEPLDRDAPGVPRPVGADEHHLELNRVALASVRLGGRLLRRRDELLVLERENRRAAPSHDRPRAPPPTCDAPRRRSSRPREPGATRGTKATPTKRRATRSSPLNALRLLSEPIQVVAFRTAHAAPRRHHPRAPGPRLSSHSEEATYSTDFALGMGQNP